MGFSKNSKDKSYRKRRGLLTVFMEGDIFTKLSFIVFGLSNIVRGQRIKGLIFLALEICYIWFMITSGAGNLVDFTTLGTKQQGMVFNEATGIFDMQKGDNSMLILLYGVVTIVITVAFVCLWIASIYSGERARILQAQGKENPSIIKDVKSLFDKDIHKLLLAIPVIGIAVFTVMPLVYMILMAFTNYDANHQPPGNLFTWVGLDNFKLLLSASGKLADTFWPIFGWTMVWGFIATFSCYFGGMLLAILINSKGIRGKKFWRTVFVITMAIPSFISLLIVSTMLGERGIINVLLQQWGFTTKALPFLSEATWARCSVIVVNLWVGVPVTMLMVSGILTNIPAELYESAKLDGANAFVTFRKITFPYMWFITTPYLISNLIGNFNNFGVIYFLTGGNPATLDYYNGAGKTDLLVTWLYKLTRDNNDFNLAATVGILVFVISATFTLISFSRSKAVTNEEGFQ